jgi:hypothetical protein
VALRLADGSDELMSGFAHSGPAKGSVTHAHLSSEPFVTVAAAFAAGVFLFGLPSPAKATDQNGTAVLNSHLPRPAPIDHQSEADHVPWLLTVLFPGETAPMASLPSTAVHPKPDVRIVDAGSILKNCQSSAYPNSSMMGGS